MANIPHDVTISILVLLPVKSLLRFKCTCKLWLSCIESQQFINTHRDLQQTNQEKKIILTTCKLYQEKPDGNDRYRVAYSLHTSLLDDEFEAKVIESSNLPEKYQYGSATPIHYVSCCHGLVLMSSKDIECSMILWNPKTRKHHEVPIHSNHTEFLVELNSNGYRWWPICCFGYDSFVDDYKIIRLRRAIIETKEQTHVDMYSLKNRTWRMLKRFPGDYEFPMDQNPVELYGAFHFISRIWEAKNGNERQKVTRASIIVSYNLVEEKFIEMFEAEDEISKALQLLDCINLCVVDQKLSLSGLSIREDKLEVWSIMNHGQNCSGINRSCFSKTISISLAIPLAHGVWSWIESARLVVCKGEVLVIREGYGPYTPTEDHIYDLKSQKYVKIMESAGSEIRAVDYVETLVSPV